jgi:hypothetical protein
MTEWFSVETKVRGLVAQLLEPLLLRSAEDRTLLEKVKRQTDSDRKKLEELEFAQTKVQRKFALLDEANRRVQELGSNLAITETQLVGRIDSQASKFEKSLAECHKNDNLLMTVASKAQHLESQFQRFDDVLAKHQESVLRQYQGVTTQVTEGLTQVRQIARELEDQTAKTTAAVAHMRSVLPLHQSRIEVLERLQTDLTKTLGQTQREMINEKKLQAAEGQFNFQIASLGRQLTDETTKRRDIEAFLEQQQPVLTQFLISSALLAAGDRRFVSRYIPYESTLLESLAKESQSKPSGLSNLRKMAEMRTREMEYRRADLDLGAASPSSPTDLSPSRSDKKRSRVSFALSVQPAAETLPSQASEQKQEITENKPIVAANNPSEQLKLIETSKTDMLFQVPPEAKPQRSFITSKSVESVLVSDKDETGNLEAMMSAMQDQVMLEGDEWVEVKLQEVLETIPILQKECGEALKTAKQSAEAYSVLSKALRSEVQTLTKRDKRGSTDFKGELGVVTERIVGLEQSRMAQEQGLTVLKEACRGLAECLIFLQTLLVQDEKDRENIQLTGYREANRSGSKPVISLNQDCLSCSGQTQPYLTAFKIACLNYAPSLVRFRGNLLPRIQVIEQVGSLVQTVVSTQLGGLRPLEPRGTQDQGTTPRSTRRVRRSLHLSFI